MFKKVLIDHSYFDTQYLLDKQIVKNWKILTKEFFCDSNYSKVMEKFYQMGEAQLRIFDYEHKKDFLINIEMERMIKIGNEND